MAGPLRRRSTSPPIHQRRLHHHLQPLPAEGLAACGNGFSAYPEAFAGKAFAAAALDDILPHARELALLGAPALAAGLAVPPAQAQPLYLRNKVAYTSAERHAINAAKAAT